MSGLGDLLSDLAEGRPDAPAVFAGGKVRTASRLARDAKVVADSLAAAGLQPGQPVGVMLPNGADTVATMFGVWAAGGVYLPLNPRTTSTEREHILESVPAAVVLTEGEAPLRAQPVESLDPEVALVTFTSGTTGRPKAVMLTHDGVLRLIDGVLAKLRSGVAPTRDDRPPMPNLVPVSLSLWAGIYTVLFAFRTGAPVVVMEQFGTRAFAALVKEHRLRSTVLPPAAMTMLADDPEVTDLEPLRFVRSITAPLSPLQARRFAEKFGVTILNGYGQTELGGEVVGWSAADAREHGEDKLGAVGRPHEGIEMRILDSDGQPAPADEAGELWIRAPAMSAGYASGGDLADRLSDDGYLRTGDIARVDGDGFLWIEGRVSDMVNRGGLKVFPAEVEEVLRLSDEVVDAAVIGIPDERLGEVPWAFVVTKPAAHSLDVDALTSLCREHLAPYKVPARIVATLDLPRNEVGKVITAELVARAIVDQP